MILMKPFFVFLLLLTALVSAEPKYDPAKLPKDHDYFELRDGLANCQRKFTQEKTGRVIFFGGSITAGGAWRQHTCDYLTKKFPDTKFEFSFEGTGCGLFIASGPDAGQIEFSVDSGPPRTLDTLTHWSSGLHLPWALILDDQLKPGQHTARVRLIDSKTALRVFHLLLN